MCRPGAVGKGAVLRNLQAIELDHSVVLADALLDAAQERLRHLTLELVHRRVLVRARLLHRTRSILQAQARRDQDAVGIKGEWSAGTAHTCGYDASPLQLLPCSHAQAHHKRRSPA